MSGDGTSDRDRRGEPPSSDNGSPHPRDDGMAPPPEPCECFCLHCRRVFMSNQIWFQRVVGAKDGFPGFWMCPTPNCAGAGFTFDIFPTDPDHPANEGWHSDEESEEDDDPDEEPDDGDLEADDLPESEWDPDEPQYQGLESWHEEDDDLEGEEWKHGLEPGHRPKVDPPPPGVEPRNWAEQEALYDAPDRRPREVDWSHRERPSTDLDDEDIPF